MDWSLCWAINELRGKNACATGRLGVGWGNGAQVAFSAASTQPESLCLPESLTPGLYGLEPGLEWEPFCYFLSLRGFAVTQTAT